MVNRFAKRFLATLAVCAVALGLTFGLAGCGGPKGPSDEELIRTSITELMDIFKNPTREKLEPYIDSTDTSTFDEYGIDIYDFFAHVFKRLDYTIDEIQIDGDTATATLTVSNVNLSAIVTEASEQFSENVLDYMEEIDMSSDTAMQELMGKLFELIYETIDTTEDFNTTSLTITLTKTDGTWVIDDSSAEAFISAMYGGMEL